MKNKRQSTSRRRKQGAKTPESASRSASSSNGLNLLRMPAEARPQTGESESDRCRRLIAQRQFPSARKRLRKLTTAAPDARSFSLLSMAELGCGNAHEAELAVDQAIQHGLTAAGDQIGFAIAAFKAGDWATAQVGFSLAAKVQPESFDVQLNLAMAAHRNEQLEVAVAAYDAALAAQPDHFNALYNRGVALKCLRRYEPAARSLELAFAQQPENVDVLCNLGQVSQQASQLNEAAHWFNQVLRIDPTNANALHCLGNISLAQTHYDQAVGYFSRSLQFATQPSPDLLNNLGAALAKLDRPVDARHCFEQALKLKPRHGVASENLGDLLVREGAYEAALAHFEHAVVGDAHSVAARVKKGRVLRRLKQPQASRAAFEDALRLDSQSTDALSEMGMSTFHEGDYRESHRYFDRALKAAPHEPLYPYLKASALPVIYEDAAQLDRSRTATSELIANMQAGGLRLDPRQHTPNTFFYLAYQGRNDRPLQESIAQVWTPQDVSSPRPSANDRRLRVGFLTRYLTDHTIGMLTGGLISSLNPERFETLTMTFEDKHPWFRSHCSEFHIAPQRPGDLIDYVAQQQLDVLVFPEIGMDALTNAVARSRMAPIQCAMWGHPVTTGIPTIDYFLSSKLLETAEADEHYSEQLVRLDTLPAFYFRPELEEGLKSRTDLSLPEDKTLYACPQSLFKFHPDFDPVLDAVLDRAPDSRLVLVEGGDSNWTRLLRRRMAATMEHHERVIWLPRLSGKDFFSLLNEADVVLDPLHFGGGRTNYLTMSAGTPLVTLPAEFMRGRVAAAMYRLLDYNECVTGSTQEYIERAVALGTDADYRRAVGHEIQARSDLLFEDRNAVNALEQFFETAVQDVGAACSIA